MNPEARDLFYLMGEVSIATVALTGIIMVLATVNVKDGARKGAQIAMQLRMSSTVTMFSVFPLIVDRFGLSNEMLWRISSGAYFCTVCYFLFRSLVKMEASFLIEEGAAQRLVVLTGLSAVILLGTNLFVAVESLHVLQLFIAWVVSLLLFRGFIVQALMQKPEDHSASPGN